MLASLIRLTRDFDLAEDALHEAFAAAARTWPAQGVPERPGAWLLTVARRKAIDRLRRAAALDRRQRQWGELALAWEAGEPRGAFADDRLRLIFTCCHPALSMEARVALTLRSLGGLSTEEVARAFLVSEATLAQRIVRAKRKIRQAAIPYRVPDGQDLPERLEGVLAVLYLIFNAGYLPASGTELVRVDLCDEALRLTLLVVALLPGEPEPMGLGALLSFQHSRRHARTGAGGQVHTLEEQDRSRWDAELIDQGTALLTRARTVGTPGPYQLKAAIAGVHARSPHASATDWPTIVALYDQLLAWEPTPVVQLNRAVAVAMAEGPEAGLALVDHPGLTAALGDFHLLHLTRADLLRRAGRPDEAADAYRRAGARTANQAEQAFVARRLEELRVPPRPARSP